MLENLSGAAALHFLTTGTRGKRQMVQLTQKACSEATRKEAQMLALGAEVRGSVGGQKNRLSWDMSTANLFYEK